MKKTFAAVVAASLFLLAASVALAHFGMIIPEYSIVPQKDKTDTLTLSFSHPFEGHGMELVKPKAFDVYFDGKKTSLLNQLKQTKVMGHTSWTVDYKVGRPGMYAFVMEPQPYPEPAEENHIIHYTKTYVSAFDEGEDWDKPLGLPVEIVPLTRPWGNYEGGSFTGQVMVNGKPAPGVRVEVEYYNAKGKYKAPSDALVTMEVMADANGVFTFACPKDGWWGFAALVDADYKIKGTDVELGGVLWIEMMEWKD